MQSKFRLRVNPGVREVESSLPQGHILIGQQGNYQNGVGCWTWEMSSIIIQLSGFSWGFSNAVVGLLNSHRLV